MWTILALSCLPCVVLFSVPSFAATKGPLTVHAGNGRYFADVSGTPVYLTGSHTWANFQERQYAVTADFDYDDYLDFLIAHNHNFMRMWSWEQAQWQQWKTDDNGPIVYSPMPFARTGPGAAIDGKPKFDLTKWNQAYFDRLRARVQAARDRGIYVSFMFFQGFSTGIKGTDSATGYSAWDGHPLNAANNINGIDGNPNGDGNGNEVHTYQVAAVTAVQEAFIRKVVNTLNDLDNVLWEIGNEMETPRAFVDGMVEFLRAYEATKTTQHPIGISGYKNTTTGSFEWTGLIDGPADFVSPWNSGGDWMGSVTAVNGTKVFLLDTDHGDPWKTDPIWVWRALCRGHNPIVMDKYTDARFYPDGTTVPDPGYAKIRAAMGESRRVALMLNLAAATPQNGLASTGYCLADAGNSYVALQPGSGSFQVTLAAGAYTVEWIDVIDGSTSAGTHTQASDGAHSFTPPSHIGTHAAALVLLRSGSTYTLNVNNGSGGGNYTAGTVVNISANAAPSGQAFDKWVVDSGNPSIADATAANTTLTMPAAAVAVTATYKAVETAPAAPTNQAASAASSSQINLTWKDNASNESGFRIERKTGSGGTWSQIATTGSNATSFSNTGLSANTTYFYRVRAYNAAGDSAYSNEASATTSGTAPAVPGSISYPSSSSTGQYTVSWAASSGATDYRLERSSDGGATWQHRHTGTALSLSESVGSGNYRYRVRAENDQGYSAWRTGGHNIVVDASSPWPSGSGAGSILREWWTGISGTAVSDLTSSADYPNNPSGSDQRSSFEAPVNWADNYGTRMRGYIHPPVSGTYTFWIASDDGGELWLSSSSDPAGKVKIAQVDSWTGSREWTKFASQKSAGIALQAGQRYYIEALQKEGGGGDNLAVSWKVDNYSQDVIAGQYLSPWIKAPVTYALTVHSGSGDGHYTAGTVVNISASTAPSGQTFDRWVVNSGNPSIANAAAASTTLTMPAAAVTVTATYKVVNNPPVANAQSVTTAENTAKAITLTGSDPDGDALTYITS